MPPLLTTASILMCPHGGIVTSVPASITATAGAPIVCQSDSFLVAGCPFDIAGAPSPCVGVDWISAAARVKHAGDFVLTTASQGLCVNAAQVPQGPVVISSTQTSASAS